MFTHKVGVSQSPGGVINFTINADSEVFSEVSDDQKWVIGVSVVLDRLRAIPTQARGIQYLVTLDTSPNVRLSTPFSNVSTFDYATNQSGNAIINFTDLAKATVEVLGEGQYTLKFTPTYFVDSSNSAISTGWVSGATTNEPDRTNYFESLNIRSNVYNITDSIIDIDTSASGVESFLSLNDTPDSYVLQRGKFVKVAPDESGVEFSEETIDQVVHLSDSSDYFLPSGGNNGTRIRLTRSSVHEPTIRPSPGSLIVHRGNSFSSVDFDVELEVLFRFDGSNWILLV